MQVVYGMEGAMVKKLENTILTMFDDRIEWEKRTTDDEDG